MTIDQAKALLRWLLGIVGGYAVGKGWVTKDQVAFLTSDTTIITLIQIVRAISALGAGIWSAIAHKQVNLVATVAAMPEVAQVITANTVAGAVLASTANQAAGPTGLVTSTGQNK